eukprot:Cvel_4144.t1-p1 / transcript=Cvel_4144.t1 / gene=Cvel_4144 / organism=Chromera_velia_CCMP2878 / gene_product=Probable beta-tubulin polyglutamylase, putative / transcript_product=Probable beta-tubulin polyglutamylase, putative / location=Cvel_scaffold177:107363-119403(+) / protein_length=1059 / sequence_SO=supercontig / SO=protein_coding / is_pseudo=false
MTAQEENYEKDIFVDLGSGESGGEASVPDSPMPVGRRGMGGRRGRGSGPSSFNNRSLHMMQGNRNGRSRSRGMHGAGAPLGGQGVSGLGKGGHSRGGGHQHHLGRMPGGRGGCRQGRLDSSPGECTASSEEDDETVQADPGRRRQRTRFVPGGRDRDRRVQEMGRLQGGGALRGGVGGQLARGPSGGLGASPSFSSGASPSAGGMQRGGRGSKFQNFHNGRGRGTERERGGKLDSGSVEGDSREAEEEVEGDGEASPGGVGGDGEGGQRDVDVSCTGGSESCHEWRGPRLHQQRDPQQQQGSRQVSERGEAERRGEGGPRGSRGPGGGLLSQPVLERAGRRDPRLSTNKGRGGRSSVGGRGRGTGPSDVLEGRDGLPEENEEDLHGDDGDEEEAAEGHKQRRRRSGYASECDDEEGGLSDCPPSPGSVGAERERGRGDAYGAGEEKERRAGGANAGGTSKKAKSKGGGRIYYHLSQTRYEVVGEVCRSMRQWKEIASEEDDWDLLWTDNAITAERLLRMRPYQKINHFVGTCAITRYIARPFLIDNLKFDLRLYVLIAGCDPLRIFLHRDGLVRFATLPYATPTQRNIARSCMHLTNYAINKCSGHFRQNREWEDAADGHKRSLRHVLSMLQSKGYDVKKLMTEIETIIVKTIVAVTPTLAHVYHSCQPEDLTNSMCFEILGFDFLLDSKLTPWLLEVNHSPSFSTDSGLDEVVKFNVIRDSLTIMRLTPENKRRLYPTPERIPQMAPFFEAATEIWETLTGAVRKRTDFSPTKSGADGGAGADAADSAPAGSGVKAAGSSSFKRQGGSGIGMAASEARKPSGPGQPQGRRQRSTSAAVAPGTAGETANPSQQPHQASGLHNQQQGVLSCKGGGSASKRSLSAARLLPKDKDRAGDGGGLSASTTTTGIPPSGGSNSLHNSSVVPISQRGIPEASGGGLTGWEEAEESCSGLFGPPSGWTASPGGLSLPSGGLGSDRDCVGVSVHGVGPMEGGEGQNVEEFEGGRGSRGEREGGCRGSQNFGVLDALGDLDLSDSLRTHDHSLTHNGGGAGGGMGNSPS